MFRKNKGGVEYALIFVNKMFRQIGKLLNSSITSSLRNVHRSNFTLARNYCQLTRTCWNCEAGLDGNINIFCGKCNFIQKVPKIVRNLFNSVMIDFI